MIFAICKHGAAKQNRATKVNQEQLAAWIVKQGGNVINLQYLLQMKPTEQRAFCRHDVERIK